jgi:integrase
MARIVQQLTDHLIDAKIDFRDDLAEDKRLIWDKAVPGLQIRIGKKRTTWSFFAEVWEHGNRGHIYETLGRYDRGGNGGVVRGTGLEPRLHRAEWHMGTDAARDAARVLTGKRIEGTRPSNQALGITFAEAFKIHVKHLETRARDRGKAARWAYNVQRLGERYMLPKWGEWKLADMAERPDLFADWITTIKSAVSANHIIRLTRSIYNRARRRNPKLPIDPPTLAADLRKEKRIQTGMVRRDFPAWFEALNNIESPMRRSFHLVNLLTGCRPGELARVKFGDIEGDYLVIRNAKAENIIEIPLTREIRDAIKIAGPVGKPGELVWPGCSNGSGGKHRKELPVKGHSLRRTYKTFAQNECKIGDEFSAFLLGHILEGLSQSYVLRWAMQNAEAIKEAQQKISTAMMATLRGESKRKRAA